MRSRRPSKPKRNTKSEVAAPRSAATQQEPALHCATRRIKVLVIIPTLDVGGAEMDLVRNLPRLDRSRFAPVVCTLRGRGALAVQLGDAGVEITVPAFNALPGRGFFDWMVRGIERTCLSMVEFLPASRFTRLMASVGEYIRLSRYVARQIEDADIDVVHAILPSAYLTAVLANMLTKRRPIVMSRVGLNWYQQDMRLLGALERWILHRRVDLALGNSEAVLQELRAEGIPNRKLLLVHNGIDFMTFVDGMIDPQQARNLLGVPQNALVFSSVGNLFPYKGHADVLYGLNLVKDQLPPNWLLLAVGRDVAGNLFELRRVADEFGLSQHVRFLGERRDVPVVLSAADIHVSASHSESFPNNILEAMCAGLPVVATAIGGVPEQLTHGGTGLLVPVRDLRALSEALLVLASSPDQRAAMARAGRARVKLHFPIARSVSGLEEAYARAVDARF